MGGAVHRVTLDGVAVPGLADAHVHVGMYGEQLETLDLRGLAKDEIVRRVAERARAAAPGAWIEGRGWDQGSWEPVAFPTAADLDRAIPDHPVVLSRIDAHSIWVNSAALRAAGVTRRTPDPPGGRIMRLKNGAPSGMLVDEAVPLVTNVMPKPTHAQRLAELENAIGHLVRLGLTSVHDADVDLDGIALYKELMAAGKLPLRVYVMARGTGDTAATLLKQDPQVALGDHRLTVRAFKVFLDGALGSRGAELLAPYSDAPDQTGLVLMKDADLDALVKGAAARGYQVNAHAIGDRAVRRALDAFEQYGGPDLAARRFRVEHASVVSPADLPRFAALGVIASMQPGFVSEYSRWAIDRLGPTRVLDVMPVADLLKSGAVIAAGTDYPAADSVNPIDTLFSMTTRRGADGKPEGGWYPAQRVDTDDGAARHDLGARLRGVPGGRPRRAHRRPPRRPHRPLGRPPHHAARGPAGPEGADDDRRRRAGLPGEDRPRRRRALIARTPPRVSTYNEPRRSRRPRRSSSWASCASWSLSSLSSGWPEGQRDVPS